jgi:hypothetical protein
MDLKALIAKMDQIESKQLLNEGFPTVADAKARADKEKTTGKFDKKELSTGTQYTRKSSTFDDGGKDKDQKKAEKKKKNEGINFQSSIAQMLLREFGLDERVTINPDGTTSGGIAKPPAAAATPNPWANDPAKSAAWAKLSPEDQKWLGGGDPTDTAILARAPNKGKAAAPAAAPAAAAPAAGAASQAVNPDSQQGQMMAAQTAGMNDPASGVAGVTGGSQQDNMLAAQTAGMDKPAPAAAAAAPAAAADPKKIARFKELLAKAGGAAPAAGAAAPAAGAAKAKPDPKVMALQQELIKKGAKIKADGIMGPQTMAAQKQFGAKASGSPAANPIKNTDANTQGIGGLDVSGSMVGA